MTIKLKLTAAIVVSMLVLAALTAWRVGVASEAAVRLASGQALSAASRGLEGLERSDVERLRTALTLLERDPALQAAFKARDREKFLALASPIFADLKRHHDVTHFYVHELSRVNWVRVHSPAQFGDDIQRVTLTKAIASGDVGAGQELGKNGFALRVVEPWIIDGATAAYLELGEEIDHFLARMRQQTGDDYALLILKARVDEKAWGAFYKERRPWGTDPVTVLANDTSGDPRALAGVRVAGLEGDELLGDLDRSGRVFARGVVPVKDASGQLAGGLVVLHDVTELRRHMDRARNVLLAILVAVAVALAALLTWLTRVLVFDRMERMSTTLEDLGSRLAGGDYDVGQVARTGPDDEIGRFESFFGSFIQVIGGLLKELTQGR